MHGDKIDVIYGKHEESMEVSGDAIPLPSQNCIQYDGRIFSVWPPALPHSKELGDDMYGLVVDIPSGWRVVDCSKANSQHIAKSVVAPYGWHSNIMVAEGPEGKLQGWWTQGKDLRQAGVQTSESTSRRSISPATDSNNVHSGCSLRRFPQPALSS